jgi:acyl-homoserine-lactone acylase
LQDEVAFDSWQPTFAELIPRVVAAYDSLPTSSPLKAKVADQIAMLRKWNYRWGSASVETSLAMYLNEAGGRGGRGGGRGAAPPTGEELVQHLADASDKLTADFGSWKTPWGDINRFQRINDSIDQQFTDAGPSIPVMFTTAAVGSLASLATRGPPTTKKRYGVSGNSFVAIIEFGADSVRARAVTAGGESGDPSSKHFNDQAERYATGNLRPVYFYPNQLVGHTERVYHPGQ